LSSRFCRRVLEKINFIFFGFFQKSNLQIMEKLMFTTQPWRRDILGCSKNIVLNFLSLIRAIFCFYLSCLSSRLFVGAFFSQFLVLWHFHEKLRFFYFILFYFLLAFQKITFSGR